MMDCDKIIGVSIEDVVNITLLHVLPCYISCDSTQQSTARSNARVLISGKFSVMTNPTDFLTLLDRMKKPEAPSPLLKEPIKIADSNDVHKFFAGITNLEPVGSEMGYQEIWLKPVLQRILALFASRHEGMSVTQRPTMSPSNGRTNLGRVLPDLQVKRGDDTYLVVEAKNLMHAPIGETKFHDSEANELISVENFAKEIEKLPLTESGKTNNKFATFHQVLTQMAAFEAPLGIVVTGAHVAIFAMQVQHETSPDRATPKVNVFCVVLDQYRIYDGKTMFGIMKDLIDAVPDLPRCALASCFHVCHPR